MRDWRRHGGLELLLALGAEGELPPELGSAGAVLEMRASIGADAARLCRARADAAARAELEARAAALAATTDLDARNAIYERSGTAIIDAADNLAYRLALNTLVAGQRVLSRRRRRASPPSSTTAPAIRALAGAIAAGDADAAPSALARELLERSIPEALMAEVLYYAIPFFVLLLVVEALVLPPPARTTACVGYELARHAHEPRDGARQRRRSTSSGSSSSSRSTPRSTS